MIKRYKEFYAALIASAAVIVIGFTAMMLVNKICAVVFLAASGFILLLFSAVTYKRVKEIQGLSQYLERINDGEYDLALADNREGELSLLKNNIYKVVVKLRSQSELLHKDKRYLADSLADISHQLKTPITSIIMMNDLLKTETDDAKRREFNGVIDGQLDRMNWLITTLLKLSKIDAGAIQFNNRDTRIKNIIKSSVSQFSIGAELKNVTITTECDENAVAVIDENWFTEAVSNIIKNCLEHTQSGGKIKIAAGETAIYTKIAISDNGCGIDSEDLPHIFERFYQGKNHSASSIGIGLALSKAIFNRQSATVDVKSEKGVGTEFEIKIYKTVI